VRPGSHRSRPGRGGAGSQALQGLAANSPFTEHVTLKTRSELIEMGMPRDFVDALPSYNAEENSSERLARDSVTDENTEVTSSVSDRSMDEIEFCEAYVRVDYDGDGVAELRKVVTCAGKIPPGEDWNEPIEAVAMTGFVMKRVPHRHVGESLDDELRTSKRSRRRWSANCWTTSTSRTTSARRSTSA
jgi:hypothetical protein